MDEDESMLISGGCDNVKKFTLPNMNYLSNLEKKQELSIMNTVAISRDNIICGGTDDGQLLFWDWKSGKSLQSIKVDNQPGSLVSEGGIFQAKFDYSASRLITVGCDKTIKMWKEITE